jgi:dTDP-4-dehydrorhamnose 3,5-epimerase
MKILSVASLAIPDIKVVRFARFVDQRGYFTEPFRRGDVDSHPDLAFLRGIPLPQINESWSRAGVLRGLHFQWNPGMGKLVRTVSGRMVDLFLDIRIESPTFGQGAMYALKASDDDPSAEWIWVPPGFAHGSFFSTNTRIEYLCTSEWSPSCEAGVSPLAPDLDWSLCDPVLKQEFDDLITAGPLMSEKDRNAPTLSAWKVDSRSQHFRYNG